MESDILTIKDVAGYLKVNERTIYRLANRGDIPAFKVGNAWRFRTKELEEWMLAQQSPAQSKQ